ncbi:hypothetical protein Tco_1095552 [Tanacetum coccineum]
MILESHVNGILEVPEDLFNILEAWLLKAPDLGLVPALNLVAYTLDIPHWRDLNGMEGVPPSLHITTSHLQPFANKRTTRSIIGRLLLAASSYYVWIKCNNRLFKNVRRSPEDLRDIIMVTVRLKLINFRFKNTIGVNRLLDYWKMPTNFRLYGN